MNNAVQVDFCAFFSAEHHIEASVAGPVALRAHLELSESALVLVHFCEDLVDHLAELFGLLAPGALPELAGFAVYFLQKPQNKPFPLTADAELNRLIVPEPERRGLGRDFCLVAVGAAEVPVHELGGLEGGLAVELGLDVGLQDLVLPGAAAVRAGVDAEDADALEDVHPLDAALAGPAGGVGEGGRLLDGEPAAVTVRADRPLHIALPWHLVRPALGANMRPSGDIWLLRLMH